MGLKMMLKALGINISEEHIAQAEKLIPQLPKVLNDAIAVINSTIAKADERLTALETSNQAVLSFVSRIHEQNQVQQKVLASILDELEAMRNGRDTADVQRPAARNGGTRTKRTGNDNTGAN